MPPTLALAICTILVIGLLRVERRRNPVASLALWVPTVAMLIYASRPLARWFSSGSENLDALVLTILILLALIILLKRQISWAWILNDNFWLILLLAYAAVSILWSEIPFVSFKRWVRLTGGFFVALVVLSEPNPLQALESIFRRCAYVLVPFSLVLVKYFPHLGREYGRWSGLTMWTGVTTQKNSLAALCAISALLLTWTFLREWRTKKLFQNQVQNSADIFVLGIALFLLLGAGDSYSATSTGILIVGITVLLLLHGRKNFARFVARYLKALVLSLIVLYLLFYESIISVVTSILGREENLTGRTDIWRPLIDFASLNPIFGVGYGGFYAPGNWELEHYFSKQFILAQAHSGYLAVYVELGIVGLMLLGVFILGYCGKVQRELSHSFEWAVLGICLLLMSLFYNYTEVGFVQSGNFLWSAMVFLMVVFSASSIPLMGAFKNQEMSLRK